MSECPGRRMGPGLLSLLRRAMHCLVDYCLVGVEPELAFLLKSPLFLGPRLCVRDVLIGIVPVRGRDGSSHLDHGLSEKVAAGVELYGEPVSRRAVGACDGAPISDCSAAPPPKLVLGGLGAQFYDQPDGLV